MAYLHPSAATAPAFALRAALRCRPPPPCSRGAFRPVRMEPGCRWVSSKASKATLRERAAAELGEGSTAAEAATPPNPNTVAPVSVWQRLGPVSAVINAYGRAQRRRPLATQFVSALCIYLCGDLGAQSMNKDEYDPGRTLRSLVIGGIAAVPSYRWFMFLGNHFNYASKAASLATKIVVNQLVFTPIFNSYFFGMHAWLAGGSLADVWTRVSETVPVSYVNSLKLWPAVTAINFTYVQPRNRAVFAGVVAVGWQTYLSWLNARAERMDENAERLRNATMQA